MFEKFTVIPAIDLLNGKVVRLTRGDYNLVDSFTENPVELAQYFADNGAKRIHLVDLDGAKDGKIVNLETIRAIRKSVNCELELGGGIRQTASVKELFSLGIDFLILGSILVNDFEFSSKIICKYNKKIIAGLDANKEELAIEGWQVKTKISLSEIIKKLNQLPIAGIIYTDIQRDGVLSGPNIASLQNLAKQTNIPIIASGGVSSIEDIQNLKALFNNGIEGVIVGKALLTKKVPITVVGNRH